MPTLRSAVGAVAPWREVPVDGIQLAYNDDGSGTAIVALHAIGHGAGDFAALRRHLAGRYRLVALDWPGHGNSDDDRQPVSAARYADLLLGFLDAVGIDRAILLGNSIGGAAAIRVAAAHPQRVRALALCNPGGLDRVDAFSGPVTRLMARFFAAGAHGARWYPRAFGLYYRLVLPAAAAQRARIIASAREVAPVLAQAWRSFGTPDTDIRGLAAQITCPVWFAWARSDRINQLTRCRPAIQRFPNARLDLFTAGTPRFSKHPTRLHSPSSSLCVSSLPSLRRPGVPAAEQILLRPSV